MHKWSHLSPPSPLALLHYHHEDEVEEDNHEPTFRHHNEDVELVVTEKMIVYHMAWMSTAKGKLKQQTWLVISIVAKSVFASGSLFFEAEFS